MNRKAKLPFDPKVFLSKVNGGRAISDYRKDQIVFRQGDHQCLASDKLILINVTWLSPSQVLLIRGVQASKSGWRGDSAKWLLNICRTAWTCL